MREEEEDEEEEEEKKKRSQAPNKVWNYEFLYEFPYNSMVISCPQT